jgi:hypothetical protein
MFINRRKMKKRDGDETRMQNTVIVKAAEGKRPLGRNIYR